MRAFRRVSRPVPGSSGVSCDLGPWPSGFMCGSIPAARRISMARPELHRTRRSRGAVRTSLRHADEGLGARIRPTVPHRIPWSLWPAAALAGRLPHDPCPFGRLAITPAGWGFDIHPRAGSSVCDRVATSVLPWTPVALGYLWCPFGRMWWSQTGSNRRHPACKADALPTELWPRIFAETGPALDCHPAPDRLYGHRMRGPVTMAPAASGDLRSMSATLREQRDARMPTADERHRGIESRSANLVAEAGLEPAIYWV